MSHHHASSHPYHDHSTQGRGRQRISKKGLFVKDLPGMMFGFGDPDPQRDVVTLMEEIVVDHITDVLITAHKVSTNRGKLKVEDIKFALESSSTTVHNPSNNLNNSLNTIPYESYPLARRKVSLQEKQISRIDELLFMQEDLARARGRADDLKAYGQDDRTDHGGGDHQQDSGNYHHAHHSDKGKQKEF